MAEYEVDSLNIEVKADTTQAVKGLKNVLSVLNKINKICSNIKMPEIKINTKSVDKEAQKLEDRFASVLAKGKSVDEVLNNAISKRDKLSSASVLGDDFGIKASEHVGGSMQYGNAPTEYVEGYAQIGEHIEEIAEKAARATPKISKLQNALGKIAKSTANVAKSGISKMFDKVNTATGKWNKSLKHLSGMLKRVLEFRVIYGILNQISEAIKTGTNNLYQYSKAAGGTFAQSMDSAAASLQYFKNSVGAAIAPIINALAPAIETAANAIVDMLNRFNQMAAALTGASSWTKAVRVQKEYAEATGDAAESTKNLLAGFDELNVIQSASSSKSADNVDYSSMFEEVALDNYQLPDFVANLKNAILAGDWAGAGSILADKLNSLFNGINWGDIGTKLAGGLQGIIDAYNSFMETINFEGIGTGIAESLNNLIYGLDFTSLGEAFAQKFNAMFDLVYGFVTEFDWTEFGIAISEGINGFFAKIDWQKLGQTINATVLGILTTLYEVITGTDWSQIGYKVATAINEIDWSEILGKFTATLTKAMQIIPQAITGFLRGINWQNFGAELWDSLIAIVTSIDYNGLITTAFEYAGSIAGAAVGLAEGLFKKLWESIKSAWEGLQAYFSPFLDEAGGDLFLGILLGIENAIKNIGTWIKEHIFTPFINGFKNAFGIASPSKEMAVMGQYIIDGLLEGLKNTWGNIISWITTSFNWIKTTITNAFTAVKTAVSSIWGDMWNIIKSVVNSILGGIQIMVNGVIKGFNSMINALNKLSFDVPDWVPGIGGEKFGFNIKNISEVSIPRLANGGFVDSAQLFMARENGMTEYVGSMGNRAAVANNDQIVEGIASGVASANSEQNALLREQNSLLRQLLAKESNVTLAPSVALGRVTAKSQQLYSAMAGGY